MMNEIQKIVVYLVSQLLSQSLLRYLLVVYHIMGEFCLNLYLLCLAIRFTCRRV